MIHLTPRSSEASFMISEKKMQERTNLESIKRTCTIDTVSINFALKRVEKGDYTILELRKTMAEGVRSEIQTILDARNAPTSLDSYKYRKQLEAEFEVDMKKEDHEIFENHHISLIRSLIEFLESGEEFSLYNCITMPASEPFSHTDT